MDKYEPLSPGTYARIESNFETPERPNHHGIDYAANFGVPIYSVSDGTVAHVGINDDPGGYGSWIVIDSQPQWQRDFTYGHMPPSSLVNPRTGKQWKYGDEVKAGDKIAVVGSEGGSTGPHLHFEVSGPPGRFGGRWLDPRKDWLPDAKDPRSITPPVIAPVETPPVTAPATPAPTARFVGKELADYSAGVPSPDDLKRAGFIGAIRYTADAREKWMGGKPFQKAEASALREAGMVVVSNFQFAKGGNDTSDWLRGAAGGAADAIRGNQIHLDAGGSPIDVIYVSIDANPDDRMLRENVLPYLQAWQQALGRGRIGVYGNGKTIQFCIDNGLGSFYWQHGWDGVNRPWREKVHPAAHIYQHEIDKSKAGAVVVDRNTILKESFGAWGNPVRPDPAKPVVPQVKAPNGYPVEVYDRAPTPGSSNGHGAYMRIYVHSTENQDWKTDAANVAAYQGRQQDGSYHDLIDDKKILQTVHRDRTAWGVLSDNAVSIQIALVLTSGTIGQWSGPNPNVESRPKTREQWLEHADMLDRLAWRIADHAKAKGIPIDRVDIAGVGANRKGVSSHNNYTYGSVKLRGYKDGTHWDIPDTFPFDVVLNAAKAYSGETSVPVVYLPPDPDEFPLRSGNGVEERWGPLEGGNEDISNQWGAPNQRSIDGLKRWQAALGIPATGVYDNATRDAALRMQQLMGWPTTMLIEGKVVPNGRVWKGEWDAVIRNGWRFPANVEVPAIPAKPELTQYPINPGMKVDRSRKIKDLTGPGTSAAKFGIGGTDLGVTCRLPSGRMLFVFGDTFERFEVGGPGWRSPVALISDTKNLDEGVEFHEALGGDPNYARQLWEYPHNNPEFSTVLPSDVITIGDKVYLHVMVNKGLGTVVWTEIWEIDEAAKTIKHTGAKFPADLHHGLAQMWTWATDGSGWVYVMSSGFQRDKPLILRRVPADRITDPGAYEGWGWKDGAWGWGNEPTPVLENASSAGKFGEMDLEYIQGQWVLLNFDTSNEGGYDIDVRVFKNITDNLYTAKKSTPIRGGGWGFEGDDVVAQLYGPAIIPGSTLDAGFHIVVSQWNTGAGNGWPYRSMQFKIPIEPVVKPLPTPVAPTPAPTDPVKEPTAPVPAPTPATPAPTAPKPTPAPAPRPPAKKAFSLVEFLRNLFRKR